MITKTINPTIPEQRTGLDSADAGAQQALTGGLGVSAN
jgi:hypothetical protein